MSREKGTNGRRRQFTPEDKATILRRHLADKVPVSDLCDEYHIQPTLVYGWQRHALEHLSAALQNGQTGRGQTQAASADRARVVALEARVARFTLATGARVPRNARGARDTAGALGAGVALCERSPAETTSSRGDESPASCTSPPPTLARSCLRSSDNAGCSAEREHAARVTRASVLIEKRR